MKSTARMDDENSISQPHIGGGITASRKKVILSLSEKKYHSIVNTKKLLFHVLLSSITATQAGSLDVKPLLDVTTDE